MTDWPAIIRDYGPLVWRTAYRLLSHEADAADCFQQTFLAAVELEKRRPIRHWPAALQRITTARALDRLRERYRTAWRSQELPDEFGNSQTDLPLEMAAGTELSEQLRIALTKIDARQAEAFCLIALEEHSYEEAAREMTVTNTHVGVLLNRARMALREQLQAFAPAGGTP